MDWRKLIGLNGPQKDDRGVTGLGPDFPESAGDREKGKFRESGYPRLVTVAVSNDDGTPVGGGNLSVEEETLLELKAIRIGIQLMLSELSNARVEDLREIAVGQ